MNTQQSQILQKKDMTHKLNFHSLKTLLDADNNTYLPQDINITLWVTYNYFVYDDGHLLQTNDSGYINYEFCHMPFQGGKVLGYNDYIDDQIRMAQIYFRDLIDNA